MAEIEVGKSYNYASKEGPYAVKVLEQRDTSISGRPVYQVQKQAEAERDRTKFTCTAENEDGKIDGLPGRIIAALHQRPVDVLRVHGLGVRSALYEGRPLRALGKLLLAL
jgi:hypothetical protein